MTSSSCARAGSTRPATRHCSPPARGTGRRVCSSTTRDCGRLPPRAGIRPFAPRNERQDELLRYLRERHEHVDLERVVSGPGLRNIYEFLRAHRGTPEPPWLGEAMQNGDPAAVISQAGLERR